MLDYSYMAINRFDGLCRVYDIDSDDDWFLKDQRYRGYNRTLSTRPCAVALRIYRNIDFVNTNDETVKIKSKIRSHKSHNFVSSLKSQFHWISAPASSSAGRVVNLLDIA
jgi:hypothetical protein